MHSKIIDQIDQIADGMIEGIKSIVRIKSVKDQPLHNQPFGAGIAQALSATLDLASSLGFEVESLDGYAGIVKYGKGDDYLGIFGHLDVVDEGTGWDHPPYSAYEDINGRIYARGILDNKGPIIANLYALYALKKLNIEPKNPIWIIFGTDEESGFHDMDHYLKKYRPPWFGWTPDCKWPVVYAERGRATYLIRSQTKDQQSFAAFINQYFMDQETSLEKLGLSIDDPEFGKMQLRSLKLIPSETNAFEFTLSYPASITNSEIMDKIQMHLPKELQLSCLNNFNPVFFDKESQFCKILQHNYELITGLDGTPVTTTGGTYAKIVPNILPYGPSFPDQKGIGHRPNEWMDRKDLIICAKIYALSMYDLSNYELN